MGREVIPLLLLVAFFVFSLPEPLPSVSGNGEPQIYLHARGAP